MGKHSGSSIQTAEAKTLAHPALSNFGSVKANRIQLPHFINQPPEKSRLPRSRRSGNQDVGVVHTEFLQFVIAFARSAMQVLELFRVASCKSISRKQ
jgi:hypothetical protein